MLNKIIVFTLTFAIGYCSFAFAASSDSNQMLTIDCAPQLRNCFNQIVKLPEARTLISNIQKEGPIRIIVNNHRLSEQFGAFWDVENRVISVSNSNGTTDGEIIASIIFELHNAQVNSKINHYDHLASVGRIDRESYVEAIERLEYENSKKASALAEKGIRLGLFPRDARLNTYDNFEEHFHYQKVGGHSAWIGRTYDQIAR